MNMNKYLEASGRTAAGTFYGDNIRQRDLDAIIEESLTALKRLDQVKKALFYNKEPSWGVPKTNDDPVTGDKDVIHAILGIATEAGELLELIGNPTDAKLVDESGDVLWYLALLYRRLGTTFGAAADKNIEKLKVRFPEKFEESLAVNRNEDEENAVFQ